MRSHANGQFPRIRFSDGRKWLFNPVLKKRFANRPEERVRLQYVEFLLHQTSIRRSRIGFEAPVKTESAENTLRADLVIYDQNMTPSVLIECKSGRIKLNEKTAEQAARYNQSLQANYLMITNGIDDFWYRLDNQLVSPLHDHPFELKKGDTETVNPSEYWINRGFLTSSIPDHILEIARNFLNFVFSPSEQATFSYLTFPADISPVLLNHYYRIHQDDSGNRLAFSVIAGASTQTVIAAVLNRDGQNQGVLWIPITELFESTQAKAIRLTPDGTMSVTIPEEFHSTILSPSQINFKKTVNQLINLFD